MYKAWMPSFAGGEIGPALYARTDTAKWQVGVEQATNAFVRPYGGLSNRPGLKFIAEVKDSAKYTRLIPFSFNTEQTYILEFGDQYVRILRNGGRVLVGSAATITGITQANPAVITAAGHGFSNGDEVYLSGIGGMTEFNGRFVLVAAATTNTFEVTDLGGTAIDSTGYDAFTSGGSVDAVYEVATPYLETDLAALNYVQSNDVIYLLHPSYAVRKLTRTGHAAWTLSTVSFVPDLAAPTGVSATATTGSGSTSYSYKVSAVDDDGGEESLPSSAASCTNDLSTGSNKNTISWSAVAGADRYIVYKLENGVYGYIGGTESTSFVDDNIDADTSDTPQKDRGLFTGTDNYPATGTFFQGRFVLAQTNFAPQTMWFSASANFENFNVSSPAKDDDSITATLAARQVNEIRAMVPLEDLIVLTSGGEWRVNGPTDGIITPSNIQFRPQGYRGVADVQPLVVGSTVLFVQAGGSVVRDLGYSFEVDGYTGNDLTVFAPHLFRNRAVVDWAFAQTPYSLVWAVRDDGDLLALTYMREHEVWGWTKHETDGSFKSIATIREGNHDAVYVLVERSVNGRTVQYIERFDERDFTSVADAFFIDSGLTYSGSATTTLTGLWHLEGETVNALSDGNVVKALVVENGSVTLPVAAEKVHIGLPFTMSIKTLSIEQESQGGTMVGRKKRLATVTLRVEDTRGLFVGPTFDLLDEWKQRATEAWGEAISLYTGDVTLEQAAYWDSQGQVCIRQTDPLPITLLGIAPEVDVGG